MAAEKVAATHLVVKAPYNKDAIYSSILLGFQSHIDAAKTRYIGMEHGRHAFRDEAPPHHIVRHVPASGTDGVFGIVLHKDLEKIRMAPPPKAPTRRRRRRNNNNSSNNNDENRRNARKARKARKSRRARAAAHGNNTANEGNVSN